MNRQELVQAIKTIRENDSTANTPKLNSKTEVLQNWLDNYNETSARQQATLEEWEELEASEDITEETTETTSEALPQVDPITGRDINWMPSMDEYEQYKANMMENCASAEYYDNGVVNYFDSERLYCVLPGYQEVINENFDYEVVALPSLANFEGIEPEVMAVTEWYNATPLTCDVLSYQSAPIKSSVSLGNTSSTPEKLGIVTVLLLIEFIKLTTAVIIPLIAFTFIAVSKLTISTTLALQGFKQAATVAKWSNRIGYSA